MSNAKRSCLLVTSIVLATGYQGVYAQSGESLRLEEVVVTAQKRQQSAQDVGMSITSLSGDELVNQGVLSTTDLAKVTPGFTYTMSPRGTPVYTLRGIGFDDDSLGSGPTVAMYVDEVPLAYSVMTRYATIDLERAEVLKGPQGILFGQNTTGGAVNFIAAKPTNEFEAGIDASWGFEYDTADLRGYISGPLTDNLKVRLSGMHTNSGEGWQESLTRSDSLGEKDIFSGRFIAEWTPVEKLRVNLMIHGWTDKSDTVAGQLLEVDPSIPSTIPPEYDSFPRINGGDAQVAAWDANPCSPNDIMVDDPQPLTREFSIIELGARLDCGPFERNDDFIQTSLRFDYDIADNIVLTSITAFADYNQDFLLDTDATSLPNFHLRKVGEIESLTQELRLTGSTGDFEWVVGANYQDDESSDVATYNQFETSPVLGFLGYVKARSIADSERQNYGFFGNTSWKATNELTFHAGLRYTEDELTYSGCTADTGPGDIATPFNIVMGTTGTDREIQPGGCFTAEVIDGVFFPGLVNLDLKEDNTSFRLGMDWQARENVMLYTNLSRGFKSGSAPAVNAAQAAQIQTVKQERVDAFEAGFKTEILEGRARINGAVYYYDYKDKQLRGRILDPFGVFGILETLLNIPESKVSGGEIDIQYTPARGLVLGLAASYTDTEVTDDFFAFGPAGNFFNHKNKAFPHTPQWHITARADYSFRVSQDLNGFAGINILFQGETAGIFHDKDLMSQVAPSPVLRPDETVDRDTFVIPDYTLVDARIGIQSADQKWRLTLWGRNIFDEDYWNNASQNLDNYYRIGSIGRTFGIRANYQF